MDDTFIFSQFNGWYFYFRAELCINHNQIGDRKINTKTSNLIIRNATVHYAFYCENYHVNKHMPSFLSFYASPCVDFGYRCFSVYTNKVMLSKSRVLWWIGWILRCFHTIHMLLIFLKKILDWINNIYLLIYQVLLSLVTTGINKQRRPARQNWRGQPPFWWTTRRAGNHWKKVN